MNINTRERLDQVRILKKKVGGEFLFINGAEVHYAKSYNIDKYLMDATEFDVTLSANVEIVDEEEDEIPN